MIEFPNSQLNIASRTYKRINTKSFVDLFCVPRKTRGMRILFKFLNSFNKFKRLSSGIKSKPINHFEVFRR